MQDKVSILSEHDNEDFINSLSENESSVEFWLPRRG